MVLIVVEERQCIESRDGVGVTLQYGNSHSLTCNWRHCESPQRPQHLQEEPHEILSSFFGMNRKRNLYCCTRAIGPKASNCCASHFSTPFSMVSIRTYMLHPTTPSPAVIP